MPKRNLSNLTIFIPSTNFRLIQAKNLKLDLERNGFVNIIVHLDNTSAASARNYCLQHCGTKYIGFIDSDCSITKLWTPSAISNELKWFKNQKIAFIQGITIPNNYQNVVQAAINSLNHKWSASQKKSKFISGEFLDTKCVIFDKKKIQKNHFSNIYAHISKSGFEDIDFGIQLTKNNYSGIVSNKMPIKHHEISNFFPAINKFFKRGCQKRLFNLVWHSKDKPNPPSLQYHLLGNNLKVGLTEFLLMFSFYCGYLFYSLVYKMFYTNQKNF